MREILLIQDIFIYLKRGKSQFLIDLRFQIVRNVLLIQDIASGKPPQTLSTAPVLLLFDHCYYHNWLVLVRLSAVKYCKAILLILGLG